ncbi:MAG: carbohydrate kinase family protein [Rectinema sp.]|nr:carbohydrate kinase family protein [Rectinema sp.]
MSFETLCAIGHAMCDTRAVLSPRAWRDFLSRSGMTEDAAPIHVPGVEAALLLDMLEEYERAGEGMLEKWSGGSAYNTARAAALQGISARFVGSVGLDEPGTRFGSADKKLPIALDLSRHEARTGVFCVVKGPEGRWVSWASPGAAKYVRQRLSCIEFNEGQGIVHCEGLLFDEIEEMTRLCQRAHAQGWKISFDLVSDGFIDRHRSAAQRFVCVFADFVFCTRKEFDALGIGADMLKPGQCLIIKEDRHGVSCFWNGRMLRQDAPSVAVVNELGAGDAYAGAFLAGVLEGSSMEHCMRRGKEMAARVLSNAHGISSILAEKADFSLH